MVQHRSILKVADNSGAKSLMVIQVRHGSKRKFGHVGDVLKCVVKEASASGQIKESDMVEAVLVRCRKEYRRTDGSYIRFSDNAAVLIDNAADKNPIGTRIFGPVARETREAGFNKITSMAEEVL